MNEFCYVLIENYLNGCQAYRHIFGVTLNQSDAYIWSVGVPPEFVTRTVEQKPYFTTTPPG